MTNAGKKALEELVAGLDGVTPGPWEPMPLETWEGGFDFFAGEDGAFVFPLDLEPGDIAHIARCSPDRIRAIATDFAALEARATAAEERVKELEAKLQKEPTPHDFVADWYAPSRCMNCGLSRSHNCHSRKTLARDAMSNDELVKNPPTIWLQSWEDTRGEGQDRMWCEDKVWPDHEDDHEPVKYVRADLAATLEDRDALADQKGGAA